eukprot:gene8866-biopygen7934
MSSMGSPCTCAFESISIRLKSREQRTNGGASCPGWGALPPAPRAAPGESSAVEPEKVVPGWKSRALKGVQGMMGIPQV